MISQQNLTIRDLLREMKNLKIEIETLETVLHRKVIPLKGITYKDITSSNHNYQDRTLETMIKVDELEIEIDSKIDSYYSYRDKAIEQIKEMRKTKPIGYMIVFYRDELHWKIRDICKITNFSRAQVYRYYNLEKDNTSYFEK